MTNLVMTTLEVDRLVEMISNEVVRRMQIHIEPEKESLLDLNEACRFTKLSKQTIYNKVANREIPHQRKAGRLYFSSTELTEWIKSGKRKTKEELNQLAESYSSKKGGYNG